MPTVYKQVIMIKLFMTEEGELQYSFLQEEHSRYIFICSYSMHLKQIYSHTITCTGAKGSDWTRLQTVQGIIVH